MPNMSREETEVRLAVEAKIEELRGELEQKEYQRARCVVSESETKDFKCSNCDKTFTLKKENLVFFKCSNCDKSILTLRYGNLGDF